MLQNVSSARDAAAETPGSLSPYTDGLVAVAYRSEPNDDFSHDDLLSMLVHAREKNAANGISGLLIAGRHSIVQWLEGPEATVEPLMRAIAHDPRHRRVSIIERRNIKARLFGEWTMLLATEDPIGDSSASAVVMPSPLAEDFRSSAFSLSKLFEEAAETLKGRCAPDRPLDLPAPAARPMPDASEARPTGWGPAARALATLLLEQGFDKVERFVEAVGRRTDDPLGTHVALLEATERRLGDLWQDDRCSETDIVMAQSILVRVTRSLHAKVRPATAPGGLPPRVLVTPPPGEQHMLPAVLANEVLWQSGWAPKPAFPDTRHVLLRELTAQRFDAVHVAMSAVFARPEQFRVVRTLIAELRDSSINPNLVITLSGRAVSDEPEAVARTGADRLLASVRDVNGSIRTSLRHRLH